jgi:DNA-binding LacI/PurR family transcriptional regulator
VPLLTTVDNHFGELGKSLANGLLSLIELEKETTRVHVKPKLVERKSHKKVDVGEKLS